MELKLLRNNKIEVKNIIVRALLEALYDVLDIDGVNSILKYANINKNNFKEPPIEILNKLIESMNILLYNSNKVLFEIGRKFAFYIAPFGEKIEDFYSTFETNLQRNFKINIIRISENNVIINVINCPFCKGKLFFPLITNVPLNLDCEFYKGFISETIKKGLSINSDFTIEHIEKSKTKCSFNIVYKNQSKI